MTKPRNEERPIRVLIADDHGIVREGLKAILASERDIVVVGEARDHVEALEAVYVLLPDVIVLDLQMPHGGARDSLRALRRGHPAIAIIILSFHEEDIFAIPFLREGADGYLAKANAAEALSAAIRQVCSGGRFMSGAVMDQLVNHLGPSRAALRHENLSAQELMVLALLASGRGVEQIKNELQLSRRTIHRYLEHILRKGGFADTAAAIRYAMDHKITCPIATGEPLPGPRRLIRGRRGDPASKVPVRRMT